MSVKCVMGDMVGWDRNPNVMHGMAVARRSVTRFFVIMEKKKESESEKRILVEETVVSLVLLEIRNKQEVSLCVPIPFRCFYLI